MIATDTAETKGVHQRSSVLDAAWIPSSPFDWRCAFSGHVYS